MHTFSKGEKRIHYNPDLSGSVQIVDTKRHVAISLSGDALKEFIESSDLFGALKVEGCYNCVLLEDKEYHSGGTFTKSLRCRHPLCSEMDITTSSIILSKCKIAATAPNPDPKKMRPEWCKLLEAPTIISLENKC